MTDRSATARWQGSLKEGGGSVALGSGAIEAPISFASRFEEGEGTNPDQLVAGGLAGCFTMALSHILSEAGTPPESLETRADVTLRQSDEGLAITRIDVTVRGAVPGIDRAQFAEHAASAKAGCAVSKALGAVDEITLDAELEG
jgi:osmotically inducible protein OsmC